MGKAISGTKEWSTSSANCLLGCSHGCLYCYARADALRRKQIASADEWRNVRVNERAFRTKIGKREGRIMFPTAHDILPEFLDVCEDYVAHLLSTGRSVLIVTKPHLACVARLCETLSPWRSQIEWRFTIGAWFDSRRQFWEPGAPSIEERISALKLATEAGYATSVSAEPMLGPISEMLRLFEELSPHINGTFWLGKMNRPYERIAFDSEGVGKAVEDLLAWHREDRIVELYGMLKDEPKVRWKESIKRVVGLPLAEEAGLDQ